MPNLVPIGGVYLLGQQQCSCALLSLQWQSMHLGNKFGRHNLAKQNGLNCCFLPKVAGLLKLFKQILIVGVGTGIIKYLWIAIPTTVVRMVISTHQFFLLAQVQWSVLCVHCRVKSTIIIMLTQVCKD